MKFSEQWLREWVNPAISTDDLAHLITMAGLEVDAVESVAGEFTGVIVAEVSSCEQHPDADKLSLCQVSSGTESVQIVCGAPNVRAGMKVALAQIGAVLPGNFKIKKAKLRGMESQGMLCADAELGISDEADGIMELPADAPLGVDVRDYLALDDQLIELDLTPNRADCLGLRGVAREVGLLTKTVVKEVEYQAVSEESSDTFPVNIEAGEGCPRYLGRVVKGVDVSCPSPLWLQQRLHRSGLRSIDPVVDVTNYVLLELGQPMHAFDLAKLRGAINVRMAAAGESIELLDGQTVELKPETLLIADDNGPIAMAGIMGGQSTAVSETTTDIMFEAAFFAPLAITGKARSYGLHTDSSHRFERGVDFELQRQAMERATALLIEIAGGEAGPITEAICSEHVPQLAPVTLRRERIEKILGFAMADADVERIFTGLGMPATSTEDGWQVAVPSWRFDIAIEADLLEELARIYGYNNLPVSHIHADLVMPAQAEQKLSLRSLRRRLTARDYQEAITNSFIDPDWQQAFDPDLQPVAVSNPISVDLSVMRTSLLPGLMSALAHNTARQQSRVRLFESGLRFLPTATGLQQSPTIAGVITGRRQPESWNEPGDNVDFYDLKGDVEALLALTGAGDEFRFAAAEREGLHPGQTAALYRQDQGSETLLGYLGALHPVLQKRYDVANTVFAFEIDLAGLLHSRLPAFVELSKYPEQRRDLAVIVDKSVVAGELLENVRIVAGTYLTDLRLFDVYEGKGIDPKRKSLALGLTFRDSSRTLSDNDVNESVDQVIDLLTKTYDAELRS
jgi:phenylalanyl-tRNA synthetase beta chain